jgi:Rad3-related DNA helicase
MIEVNGKKIYYPIKYVPKKYQIEALDFIKKSILTGNKYILLNLPTGTGKSFIISTMFTNWYKNYVNDEARFDILTNSKILQDQYIKDFDFINVYKGKSNYYCAPYSCSCDIGKDLCKDKKLPCSNTTCPYDQAKNRWMSGSIGLTNFHLYNTLALYQTAMLDGRASNVLIIDESHDFESTFSDFLSTKVSAKTLKKCGFDGKEIEILDDRFISKIKHLDKYLEFVERKLIPELEKKLLIFEGKVSTAQKNQKIIFTGYIQQIQTKLEAFNHLFKSYENDPNNIVLDINKNKSDKMFSGIELTTQHIWVYEYINDYIWKKYDHVIFMSASILDKQLFSFINGLDDKMTTYYEIPTPFDVNNRKIYYLKIGKMNYSNKEETFKNMIPWIKKIIGKYKDKKGILHTTNYEIVEWVKENITDSRLLFHNNEDRNEILEKHLTSLEPTILVSPSMMSGVDLKDDLARFQILLKIPYPNVSSNKIKGRQKSNPNWYTWKTIVDTLQMYGRSTRSDVDFSDTFILDSNFSDLLKYNSHMIPKYFIDAIKILNI